MQAATTTHSVRSHLRLAIDSYDETIRKFIPGYETGLAMAAQAVAERAPKLVLDLGAGTGALSAVILKHAGVGQLLAIDLDPEMLARAEARLQEFGSRVRFQKASFSDPLPDCDGVTASLALHHVATMDEKRTLYRRIHSALRPGGIFANADVTVSDNEQARKAVFDRWADHLVASGIERRRAFEHFAEWAEEDTYFPLEDELGIMREAGFNAKCVWQETPNCVLVGVKSH